MEETRDTFDPSLYRSILAQNKGQDIYKAIESQRKCTVLSFEAACKSLDNASACDLLTHRLDNYTKTIYKDGKNLYNSLLLETHPDLSSKRRFKVPEKLPKMNLNRYLTTLDCAKSNNNLFCNKSEKISRSDLDQFGSLFIQKTTKHTKSTNAMRKKTSLEDRFENLDKLQETKTVDTAHSRPQPPVNSGLNSFITARVELENQVPHIKLGLGGKPSYSDECVRTANKKSRGTRKTKNKFVSPLLSRSNTENEDKLEAPPDKRLENIDPKMVALIKAEIMDQDTNVTWADIAGLEFAKSAIQEAVVWPMLRPDIFTGLRRPPKGILLFGPPGTGKTLIGKCVASQSKSTFFNISASSLTSKWLGDGEKMVRALFEVARAHQPAVIFIDEVDSLLTQRSDTEHECTRRIKTEFLVRLDGASTDNEEKLLVIGATNRPQELDEAARRRFVKRLYIPLPEYEARLYLLKKLISNEKHALTEEQFQEIARLSDGYSGADIKNLCSEAALGPIRCIDFENIGNIQASEVRPLTAGDFEKSFKTVRPSVSRNDLFHYVEWDKTYGSGTGI